MPKSDTPKALLDALAMVRDAAAPMPESVGTVESLHVGRVRNVFADRNIVGIGISEKVTERKQTGELSLCFYVEKKIAKSRVTAEKMVPPVMSAPGRKAVFTDVKEIGLIRPQINRMLSPIQSGFSVGRASDTGSVGALVKKGRSLFILSNSHVLAGSGRAHPGAVITYPSSRDRGNDPRQVVGRLADFVQFKKSEDFVNNVDAALAEVDAEWIDDIDARVHKGRAPLKTAKPVRGMKVVKSGRTTGETEGEILDVNFSIVVKYDGVGKIGFIDQVLCTRYTAAGDSGALVVAKSTGKVVGLHFAGSAQGSVFNPIGEVIKALKFRFVNP